jgi:hypothetical protein
MTNQPDSAPLAAERADDDDPDTSRRAQPRVHAHEDSDPLTAARTPASSPAGAYLGGFADSRLRRALARLRRRPDPELQTLAEQLAAEAAEALSTLADRADAADPVLQRRRAAQQRKAEQLAEQLATARARRERRPE